MLYSIESARYIRTIPHRLEFNIWTSRLADSELDAITEKLNEMIDGDEIHTAGWMPGPDWTGTVFEPIYEKACNRDEESAAKCFGLLVWKTIQNRDDVWSFGRYEKNEISIKSITYFKLYNPPPD